MAHRTQRMQNVVDKVNGNGNGNGNGDSLEGKYKTMSGANLSDEYGFKNLDGSTDYYYAKDKKGKMVIKGEVDLEGGKVTGVYGSDPSFYGTDKHQRK